MVVALASTVPTEVVNNMTHDIEQTVNVLTQRIRLILDSAKGLTNINMASEAGRQFVAAIVADQLIHGRGTEDNPPNPV